MASPAGHVGTGLARSTVDRACKGCLVHGGPGLVRSGGGGPSHGGAIAVVAVLAATAKLGTGGRAEGTNASRAARRVLCAGWSRGREAAASGFRGGAAVISDEGAHARESEREGGGGSGV